MVYRTDLSGHLRLISDGNSIEVLEGSLQEIAALPVLQRDDPPAMVRKKLAQQPKKRGGRK
jgi:hypothetical protein